MPPRYSYWTIIAGGLPTAFRAAERDELLPTFKRIQEKHPDAELKYFAQGRLWASPDEARQARESARTAPSRPAGAARGKDWRPGGAHRDPRQKFIDQKKERNQRWRQDRFDKKASGPGDRGTGGGSRDRRPPVEKPHGDPLRRNVSPSSERRPWNDRPPRTDWRNKPGRQDWREGRPDFKRPDDKRPSGHQPPTTRPSNRGGGGQDRPWRDRPGQDRPWRDRPHDQTREDNKPPRGPRPDREPRRGDEDPKRPPRPSEPRIEPPGPPERGRSGPPRNRPAKGPRRPFKKNSR